MKIKLKLIFIAFENHKLKDICPDLSIFIHVQASFDQDYDFKSRIALACMLLIKINILFVC